MLGCCDALNLNYDKTLFSISWGLVKYVVMTIIKIVWIACIVYCYVLGLFSLMCCSIYKGLTMLVKYQCIEWDSNVEYADLFLILTMFPSLSMEMLELTDIYNRFILRNFCLEQIGAKCRNCSSTLLHLLFLLLNRMRNEKRWRQTTYSGI